MEHHWLKKQSFLTACCLFAVTYAFLCFLNGIFPTQSDDIGRSINGISYAIDSYKTWNGRFGELMLVTFGSYFSTTPYYAPINSLIGASVIMLIFINIFGRFPKHTLKDVSCFSIFFLYLMADPAFSFGSVFYWAAGSFNYLWAWFFILLLLTPCTLFWRGITFSKKVQVLVTVLSVPLGVLAGWSSEFAIVILVFFVLSIVYARIKNKALPVWYYIAAGALLIGWLILYTAPGLKVRALSSGNYRSLSTLLHLGPLQLALRIIDTFEYFCTKVYYEIFFFLSLFLFLTALFYNPSAKKWAKTILVILFLFVCLRFLPALCFMTATIVVCALCRATIRHESPFLSRYFTLFLGALGATFLFVGATIQIGIPARARLQTTLLCIVMLAINMDYCFAFFKDNKRVQQCAAHCCIGCTGLFALFVGIACMHMHHKWIAMETSIAEQKARQISPVVITHDTFASYYWNYGDWGNPDEDPDTWPNTTYADFYGVEKLIAR